MRYPSWHLFTLFSRTSPTFIFSYMSLFPGLRLLSLSCHVTWMLMVWEISTRVVSPTIVQDKRETLSCSTFYTLHILCRVGTLGHDGRELTDNKPI